MGEGKLPLEQKLTVSGFYPPGWYAFAEDHAVPLLLFAGSWLKQAGFYEGGRVRVDVVGRGRMVVSLAEPGEEL